MPEPADGAGRHAAAQAEALPPTVAVVARLQCLKLSCVEHADPGHWSR